MKLYIRFVLVASHSKCGLGDKCQLYAKNIGMTLDDILRDEIRPNMTLNNQSISLKMSAALTMIMLVAGLINSMLSFLTFYSKDLRKVGCGIYLLASSVVSLLTISIFTVRFWFLVLTQMNVSISLSVLRGGCRSIEPMLKLFIYLDAWLNACVAVERAVHVAKGIKFDKEKSKRIARWIILILPFCIMSSIIHEPLYRKLIENKSGGDQSVGSQIEKDKKEGDKKEEYVWCLTLYSRSVQDYNTFILFLHLVGPFTANLFSALFIVFGSARQRAVARTRQTYREHVYEQLREHKQLLISPLILLVLSLPRLIIALLSGCVDASRYMWLYLSGYFISFTPSMLVFVVFVLPSELYRNKFKESLRSWHRRIH
jgi:hypothetical protein